ncbi:MAG: hypothetical protein IJD67_01295 [Clostridia bacterium]|nr:hypothetical protein [Clostridia bacterium]
MMRMIIKGFFLAALMTLLCINAYAATDTDGYTLISTPGEFIAISDELDGEYRLANDIDFTDFDFEMIVGADTPFTGVLDGAGYSLKNITITASNDEDLYVAVFVTNNGVISNVVFDGVSISAGSNKSVYAAVVAAGNSGVITDVTVQNSSVTARTGYYAVRAAAISAYNYRLGSIDSCVSSANVKAVSRNLYSSAAGIAAVNLGKINRCINSGSIISNAAIEYVHADGISAEGNGSVENCESTGEIYTGVEDILLGDVDGDGSITPTDGVVLSRYLANWTGYENSIVESAADVDENTSIDPTDGVVLSRHLAKWTGYEILPFVG